MFVFLGNLLLSLRILLAAAMIFLLLSARGPVKGRQQGVAHWQPHTVEAYTAVQCRTLSDKECRTLTKRHGSVTRASEWAASMKQGLTTRFEDGFARCQTRTGVCPGTGPGGRVFGRPSDPGHDTARHFALWVFALASGFCGSHQHLMVGAVKVPLAGAGTGRRRAP